MLTRLILIALVPLRRDGVHSRHATSRVSNPIPIRYEPRPRVLTLIYAAFSLCRINYLNKVGAGLTSQRIHSAYSTIRPILGAGTVQYING